MASAPSAIRVVKAAGFIVYRLSSGLVEYLLLQSSKKPHHWTPPKGHLEQGETNIEAAYRETEEEAGLTKEQLRLIDSSIPIEYTAHGKPKLVTYWIAELTNPDAPIKISHEHQAFKWAKFDEATELVFYEDFQTLLARCNSLILLEL